MLADLQRGLAGRCGAAGGGADAGQELVDAEGFGDVVVGSGVQGFDLVGAAAAAGQHDDRGGGPAAQAVDDLDAVHVGQAEVEHDEVGRLGGRGTQGTRTVRPRHVVPGRAG